MKKKKYNGFTLLEVMLCIAIVGLTLATLLVVQDRNLRKVRATRDHYRAAMLAAEIMAEAEMAGHGENSDEEGDFSEIEDEPLAEKLQNFRWSKRVEPADVGDSELDILEKITVIVTYPRMGGEDESEESEGQVVLTTFLCADELEDEGVDEER